MLNAEAWAAHNAKRWMRPDAARFTRPTYDANAVRDARAVHAAGAQLLLAGLRSANLLLKGEAEGGDEETPEGSYGYHWEDQPRAPAGGPDGGQWVSEGGGDGESGKDGGDDGGKEDDAGKPASESEKDDGPGATPDDAPTDFSDNRRRSPSVHFPGSTLAQQVRYEVARVDANNAIQRVQEIQPGWRAPRDLGASNIESAITNFQAQRWAAEARFQELQWHGRTVGPFAGEGVPLTAPRGTVAEREQVYLNGLRYGCHTCGTFNFGTASGNPYLDHQRPTSINPAGAQQFGYPHCAGCSSRQGVHLRWNKY
ncbi:hypothetical protein GJW-30_1_03789 [Variibacter gotjawalensis]|uniref:Uncharacterized protein n=1 Tax=Variibacter gotjawalensis TaxID=1333996 RepID=A0A0S3PZS7_9BRAD|nr:hypothetical protein [Variibacter gotjawalensis]NIK47069.1 hypothetical protein [Variibacter gotjawalensis]RZS48974.1 hypothetical protein EV661_1397 [Variibacter gotjawalensis]BAT61232.1 hypothetical protein GJW-30_1_03789 [Variibacter gotjawalensis]